MGRGRETLGQRLARTIADDTSIDTTSDMEHTKQVELETFSGRIDPFAGNKEEGAEEAKRHTDRLDEIYFWTDGSRMDTGHTEVSVECRNPEWKTQRMYLGTNKKVFSAELYAMGECLEIVLQSEQGRREADRHQSEPQ